MFFGQFSFPARVLDKALNKAKADGKGPGGRPAFDRVAPRPGPAWQRFWFGGERYAAWQESNADQSPPHHEINLDRIEDRARALETQFPHVEKPRK